MGVFRKTQYPFTFVDGANRYDIPFSLIYDNKPLDTNLRQIFKIAYEPFLYTDTEYYDLRLTKTSGAGDLYYFFVYKVTEDSATSYRLNISVVLFSEKQFTAKLLDGTKFVDYDYYYSVSENFNENSTFTYDGKIVYYQYYDTNITYSQQNTTATKTIEFGNKLTVNDWNVYYHTTENYFAWLGLNDSIIVNDPYNRPEQTPAPRGGNGSWDNSTDNISPDAIPTGNWGKGFVNVYNPTQNELAIFGAVIWDETVRTNLNDIFPQGLMSGIVDCFTIPIAPDVSGTGDIVIGGKPLTGLITNIVSNRFKSVNCGTLTGDATREYFGGFPDYATTKIAIYLPYIGYQQLAPEMVLNCSLSLEYRVDCMTGDCVAILTSVRNDGKFNYNGVSYLFNGNCASKIPLTASTGAGTSDYISTAISGLSGVATGVASMAMGNPLGAIGAISSGANTINSIMSMSDKIGMQIKGGFSGSKGQLSPQTPYLIFNRPVMENGANNEYFQLCGIPSNDYARVEQCFGFTKALECIVTDTNFENATNDEKQEIYNLLKSGVIV